MVTQFWEKGWARFPVDPSVQQWVAGVLPLARAAVDNPAHAQWHVCEGTWFVGVDALDNDAQGRVGGSVPLAGSAIDFLSQHYGALPLHKAQVSAIYPGYPRPRQGESEAAARYRAKRDAAHVDGLRPNGPERRRRIEEPHAWILGIPLNEASADAAPLVLWEGSHKLMADAFRDALAGVPPEDMAQTDVTEIYQAARRTVFDTCKRIEVPARPGEAYVLHRHCLHGVAPWGEDASAGSEGRMIAYFRPEFEGGVAEWIEFP